MRTDTRQRWFYTICYLQAVKLAVTCLLIMVASASAQPRGFDPDAIYAVPLGDSPRRGPGDALITVVEFSDFSCRFCQRSQAVLEQLERLYPGQNRWVFRHFPLDEDDGTLPAEAAVAAAAQGRFWPMHDRLFAVRGQVDRAAVELYATELGLDLARFRADLDSGIARETALRDWKDGLRLGVSGTPAFFINGRAVNGARSLGRRRPSARPLCRAHRRRPHHRRRRGRQARAV
jgi:protein-disulfide isomerase